MGLGLLGMLVWLGAASSMVTRAQAQERREAEPFRALLAPHGAWVSVAGHGEAFVPREANDETFVPYLSGGRWEARDAGLSFVSTYAWGEVCFHQGRWLRTEESGTWVWLPGRAYASAWVEWRRRGHEVAWRALGPGDGPADRREGASSWNVAPRDALGSALLASSALRVSDAAVVGFARASQRGTSQIEAGDEPEAEIATSSVETPRVGRDQVLVSGGGRIVVHGPSGDRVLTAPPVIVSRATAEARARDEARREAARREREAATREELARLESARRDRDAAASAERAAQAADVAAHAAVTASRAAESTQAQTTRPMIVGGVWPYGGYGSVGYGASFGVGGPYGGGGYGATARPVERPAPAPVAPPPAPTTPRTPPIVGSARGAVLRR